MFLNLCNYLFPEGQVHAQVGGPQLTPGVFSSDPYSQLIIWRFYFIFNLILCFLRIITRLVLYIFFYVFQFCLPFYPWCQVMLFRLNHYFSACCWVIFVNNNLFNFMRLQQYPRGPELAHEGLGAHPRTFSLIYSFLSFIYFFYQCFRMQCLQLV